MTSARAYRAAMPIDDAESALMSGAGAAYDRGPVSALASHLENRGGRAAWAQFGEPPEQETSEA
jgi:HD-GYP domain-containing protein (c-di-GMP phosphodiesterase class II)